MAQDPQRLRVGLLVNPVAGLGGPGAYKGSDGKWRDALAAGYKPTSPDRARRFVAAVGPAVDWLTVPGVMGAEETPGATIILGDARFEVGGTSPQDTERAAAALRDAKVDLLCFLGGDGTAADVSRAVGDSVPCLGVPAGVKVTSAVFAHDVEEAAWLVRNLAPGFETIARDVTDLDEVAYRTGHVDIELKGMLRVPVSPAIQDGKVATASDTPMQPLVDQVLQDWDAEALNLVGAGSVCLALKKQFWGEPTLLGVDAVQGTRLVANDLSDRRIAELVAAQHAKKGAVRIYISPIGGQGMLLGRGTQVFRPEVLRTVGWDALRVVAPPEKLLGLKGLHIDTGDPALDATAPKHLRVVTGWNEFRMVRLLHGPPTTNGNAASNGGNGAHGTASDPAAAGSAGPRTPSRPA